MNKFVCAIALLIACSFQSIAFAAPIDELRALVEQARFEDAYAFGSRYPDLLGNVEFDFYFGVSAVDTGHAGEGVLALERHVVRNPDNLAARAELARAYLLAGEDMRAREEFEAVLKSAPSSAIRKNIDRFLDIIAERESRYRATATFHVEAGVGADSNVNGGVSDASINLPVFGNVNVMSDAVRKSDVFSSLAAGAQVSWPLTKDWSLVGGAGIDGKFNRSHQEYDLRNTTVVAGVRHQRETDSYGISLAQDVVNVDSDRFRTALSMAGEWQHRLGQMQALQTAAQFVRYTYSGANEVRDATYGGMNIVYRRAFAAEWQPLLQLGTSYGRESNDRDRPDLGRDIAGLRVALSLSPHSLWHWDFGISYQGSRYTGIDTLLATRRRDDYRAIDAAATYAYSKNISLRGELLLSENESNLSLYQYRRNVLAAKLRYEFK